MALADYSTLRAKGDREENTGRTKLHGEGNMDHDGVIRAKLSRVLEGLYRPRVSQRDDQAVACPTGASN